MNNDMRFKFIIGKLDELRRSSTKTEETKCSHDDYVCDKGIKICKQCGEMFEFSYASETTFDNDSRHTSYSSTQTTYVKSKNFRNLMKRLNGFIFNEKNEPNIDEMPNDLKGIRNHLRKYKLNRMNDFYYWRIKNNISANSKITIEQMINWETEFKRSRKITAKDFLFEKISKISYLQELANLVSRKIVLKK